MTYDVPVMTLPRGVGSALTPETLRCFDGEPLVRFLERQRWFSAKNEAPHMARFADVIPLFPSCDSAVTRVEVTTRSGAIVHFQLVLSVGAESEELRDAPHAALARLEVRDTSYLLYDAVYDPSFRAAVLKYVADERSFTNDGATWRCQPATHEWELVPFEESRVLRGEQSNTSIAYDDSLILKLFRRLERGEHPEVELSRFLSQRALYPHVPAYIGTIVFEHRGEPQMVAGMVQAMIPGAVDAWVHARRVLGAALRGELDTEAPLIEEIKDLGSVTRGLHEALVSEPTNPDFAPARAGHGDVHRWVEAVDIEVDRTLQALQERVDHPGIGAGLDERARRVLKRREQLHRRLNDIASAVGDDAGMKIRHHGDYHLGQVLRSSDGDLFITDFEGEPARPLADRRGRHSPLRDVAAMLRSLAYLAVSARSEAEAITSKLDLERWQEQARHAFLEAYRHAGPVTSEILPRAWESTTRLLDLFELERLLYELRYELSSRPEWVGIPLAGIERLLAGSDGHRGVT